MGIVRRRGSTGAFRIGEYEPKQVSRLGNESCGHQKEAIMANQINVNETAEKAINRFIDDLKGRLLGGNPNWEWALPRLQAVSEGREFVPATDEPTRSVPRVTRAQKRRDRMAKWYKGLGFEIDVPVPAVSNGKYKKKEMEGKRLFYRPATSEMSYDAFMCAVGQSDHWTVTHEDRNRIKWEAAEQGYWFWAEVQNDCPRNNTSWNDLSGSIRLLCLEEYVIVWHAHKAQTKILLDHNTWTWLRTRYQYSEVVLSALYAFGCLGWVSVNRAHPVHLSRAFDGAGGRSAEVIKSAT